MFKIIAKNSLPPFQDICAEEIMEKEKALNILSLLAEKTKPISSWGTKYLYSQLTLYENKKVQVSIFEDRKRFEFWNIDNEVK
jgi:hypothetical protein